MYAISCYNGLRYNGTLLHFPSKMAGLLVVWYTAQEVDGTLHIIFIGMHPVPQEQIPNSHIGKTYFASAFYISISIMKEMSMEQQFKRVTGNR